MEPVRMQHEKHGWTHAYSQAEIEKLQGFGWEIEKPVVVASPEMESALMKRKPGRPRKAA